MPAQSGRVIEVRPDDRVLILGIPEPAALREMALRLISGVVVALGEDEAVAEARRAHRDLANVMCIRATPDEIPWRDSWFTRVIDLREGDWPDPDKVAREIRRVLAPGS